MSKTVFRYDRGELRRPERTSQGFLRVEGRVAKAGVYEYRREDGSVQLELRPEEEVFSPRALASYDGVPITLGHPRRADGQPEDVTAENVKRYEVGTVLGAARRDGDYVVATLLIKDAAAIKRVEAGQQELSPGYRIRLDETPGVHPKYGKYHAVQRGYDINHQAVVDRARGGTDIRLRMDDAEMVLHDDIASPVLPAAASLPAFAVPEDQGLAIVDVSQIRESMRRFDGYLFATPEQRKAAYRRIVRRGIERDVDVSSFAAEHRADAIAVMTTVAVGHQHLIDPKDWNGCDRNAGDTSHATSEGETMCHSHPWTRDPYGKFTIGESDGHGHEVLVDDAAVAVISGARP